VDELSLVKKLLENVYLGTPQIHKNIVVVPLISPAAEAGEDSDLIPLQEAIAKGLRIKETCEVERVLVQNWTERDVFLMESEGLVGGYQNRAIAKSVVVAARSQRFVEVNCVEKGRWRGTRSTFDAAGMCYASLREEKLLSIYRSGSISQDEVWAEIDGRLSQGAKTYNMFSIYQARRQDIEEYMSHFYYASRSMGAMVIVGGGKVHLDLYWSARVMKKNLTRLLRSAVVETSPTPGGSYLPPWEVKSLLGEIPQAKPHALAGEDGGMSLLLASRKLISSALIYRGRVVHLSAHIDRSESDKITESELVDWVVKEQSVESEWERRAERNRRIEEDRSLRHKARLQALRFFGDVHKRRIGADVR